MLHSHTCEILDYISVTQIMRTLTYINKGCEMVLVYKLNLRAVMLSHNASLCSCPPNAFHCQWPSNFPCSALRESLDHLLLLIHRDCCQGTEQYEAVAGV